MNQISAAEIAKLAAKEAVKEHEREVQKKKEETFFKNTKKLMENYNRICKSIDEGITELSEINHGDSLEELSQEDLFLNCILKSKLRSIVVIAHIDKCLKLLENEQIQKNSHEKYRALAYFYLNEMTQERIAEILNCSERTVRRWIADMTSLLSVYLFGTDAVLPE